MRCLWQLLQPFRQREGIKADELFHLLIGALNIPVPPFDDAWRASYDKYASAERESGFEACEALLLRQIVDLREMAEANQLVDPMRFFGTCSPRGRGWNNSDLHTYLECASRGMFGGWEPGDPTGVVFVPGKVAVLGDGGSVEGRNPEDLPRPVFALDDLDWDDFWNFLHAAQLYE